MKTKHHSILSTPVIRSGNRTQNNSIRRKWFALAVGGFLFTSIFALSAPPVEAQCQQWNVGHAWQFKQGAGKGAIEVKLDLHQNGTVITGTANHQIYVPLPDTVFGASHGGFKNIGGDVDGTVKGDQFDVIIHWNNNTTGIYNGTIGPSGRIEGTGYEQRSSSKKVNWYSETHMECADAAPVSPKPETKSASAAADDWLEQERRKRKTAAQPTPSSDNKARGFINGLQLGTPTPTPNAEAAESASSDTEDQHKKNKKKNKNKKKHHHHHDDDQDQGND